MFTFVNVLLVLYIAATPLLFAIEFVIGFGKRAYLLCSLFVLKCDYL